MEAASHRHARWHIRPPLPQYLDQRPHRPRLPDRLLVLRPPRREVSQCSSSRHLGADLGREQHLEQSRDRSGLDDHPPVLVVGGQVLESCGRGLLGGGALGAVKQVDL